MKSRRKQEQAAWQLAAINILLTEDSAESGRGNAPLLFSEKMKPLGTEWLIEATGCRPATLRDVAMLAALFDCIITELQLSPVAEPVWHKFPGEGGVTGFVLLAESHLACHTWPERQSAAFNLFCCKPRPAWQWAETLREMLGAAEVNVRQLQR